MKPRNYYLKSEIKSGDSKSGGNSGDSILIIIINVIDQHVFRCVQKLSCFHQTGKLKANPVPSGISDDL